MWQLYSRAGPIKMKQNKFIQIFLLNYSKYCSDSIVIQMPAQTQFLVLPKIAILFNIIKNASFHLHFHFWKWRSHMVQSQGNTANDSSPRPDFVAEIDEKSMMCDSVHYSLSCNIHKSSYLWYSDRIRRILPNNRSKTPK